MTWPEALVEIISLIAITVILLGIWGVFGRNRNND